MIPESPILPAAESGGFSRRNGCRALYPVLKGFVELCLAKTASGPELLPRMAVDTVIRNAAPYGWQSRRLENRFDRVAC